ncbi:ribonuclease H2 subunit A-like [Sycon ciliatum]|uniref:ribonuclease H2 subunit A-like n=1 Tax=Sycon ciliatum TaxID=27933 RepID=UPI0020A95112|eukprot:scpid82280/ scgid32541/ Ribonuclease H2 subunit A; Aicardi-Goutieres syndrome 4 protein; RNase H(35); Ribonuclease HI large subunit; Ribonuclease HI subunit A
MSGELETTDLDLSEFHADNSGKLRLDWPIPEVTKNEPCCLGIDEAGRGPVLGPMVYGTAFCPVSMNERLAEMGFADSKTLKEEERETLLTSICEATDMLSWATEIISPNYISTQMLKRSKCSLNVISHTSAIGLIQYAIDQGVHVSEVYVDTVGPPAKYQDMLSAKFPGVNITVSAKADAKFPIVSAASICAKVVRDRVLKSWKFNEMPTFSTANYGSGYPADPNTKDWLVKCIEPTFGFTQFIRFSWSTCDNLLDARAAAVTWEDDDDDEQDESKARAAKKTKKLTQFFAPQAGAAKKPKPHRFFDERHLQPVSSF